MKKKKRLIIVILVAVVIGIGIMYMITPRVGMVAGHIQFRPYNQEATPELVEYALSDEYWSEQRLAYLDRYGLLTTDNEDFGQFMCIVYGVKLFEKQKDTNCSATATIEGDEEFQKHFFSVEVLQDSSFADGYVYVSLDGVTLGKSFDELKELIKTAVIHVDVQLDDGSVISKTLKFKNALIKDFGVEDVQIIHAPE